MGNKGVLAATPTGLGQGMILKDRGVGGVMLEGVDLNTTGEVTPWKKIWVDPPAPDAARKYPNWIWVGAQLAKKLQVKQGDTVNVLLAGEEAKKVVPFVVTAITKFGIYDHDLRYAYIDLKLQDQLFHHEDLEPIYKTKVKPGVSLDAVADELDDSMGKMAVIKKWSDINQNIFLAVQHQKKMLFLVLEIIIALAAMNVVNLLMMSSYQRRRDIAILRAMGMRLGGVLLFFVAQGAAVGVVGVFFGVILGYVVCHLVERFQPAILSEAVYNVTRLPIRIELGDTILVCVVALILCILFSLIPAVRAALSRPVKALRYE
jgi:lipoprotein-releasing system permease protein